MKKNSPTWLETPWIFHFPLSNIHFFVLQNNFKRLWGFFSLKSTYVLVSSYANSNNWMLGLMSCYQGFKYSPLNNQTCSKYCIGMNLTCQTTLQKAYLTTLSLVGFTAVMNENERESSRKTVLLKQEITFRNQQNRWI